MSEAVAQYRWERRLLLLALTVGGLWLIGLLGHTGQAHADPVSTASRPAPAAAVAAPVAPSAAAPSAVSALLEKTVAPTVTPAGREVQTVLKSAMAPVLNHTVVPVGRAVQPVVAPVARAIQPVLTPIAHAVQPIAQPVLAPILAPVLNPVAPILAPIPNPAAPITSPVLGQPGTGSSATTAPGPVVAAAALLAGVRTAVVAPGRSVDAPMWAATTTSAAPVLTRAAGAAKTAPAPAAAPSQDPRPLPVPAPTPATASAAGSATGTQHSFDGFDAVCGQIDSTVASGGRRVGAGSTPAPREQAYCPSVSPD